LHSRPFTCRRNPIYFEMKIFGIKILVKNLDMKI